MKKRFFDFTFALFLVFSSLLLFSSIVSAEPYLQLDISDGIYNDENSDLFDKETIFATTNPFTLYALINTNDSNFNIDETYYVSFAIINTSEEGGLDEGTDLPGASFSISYSNNGTDYLTDYLVTEDMVYGTPPIVEVNKDLQSHGIFDTYFIEIAFQIDIAKKATLYNSADYPGTFTANPDGELYYQDFGIEYSLPENYSLYMSLYTLGLKKGVLEVTNFVPFSHDAQAGGILIEEEPPTGTGPVPEPATMLLFGIGLIGFSGVGRRNFLNK